MSTSRDELRARNVQLIARWLSAYVREGHGLTLETRFGPNPTDNQIVFCVTDWPAFEEVMDPGRRASA